MTYNNLRTDVQSLFPGYANSAGAGGYRVVDTTALTNGLHSIAWGVRDDLGRTAGVGSRYFTVLKRGHRRTPRSPARHNRPESQPDSTGLQVGQ